MGWCPPKPAVGTVFLPSETAWNWVAQSFFCTCVVMWSFSFSLPLEQHDGLVVGAEAPLNGLVDEEPDEEEADAGEDRFDPPAARLRELEAEVRAAPLAVVGRGRPLRSGG